MVLGFLVLIALALYLSQDRIRQWAENLTKETEERMWDMLELGTVLVVTMQVIVLLQDNHLQLGGEELQSPFQGFLTSLSFLGLDFVRLLPMSCVSTAGHFDYVLAWSLLPVLIFGVGAVTFRNSSQKDKTTCVSYYVQGLFLFLPTISTTICETFRCTSFDHGDFEYLAVDYEVDCHSEYYRKYMVGYAVLACLVYPVGVPLGMFLWLWKYRQHLDPVDVDEEQAVAERVDDPALQYCAVAVFALRHKPRYWYFEVYNMLRRIVLTSFPLVFTSVDSMLLFILAVAIITTCLLYTSPSPRDRTRSRMPSSA